MNRLKGLLRFLDAYWFGPTPAWPLAAFRAAFAAVLTAYFSMRMWNLQECLGDSPARVPDLDVTAGSILRYAQPFYFAPVSDAMMPWVVGSFYFLALALFVGCFTRLAAGLLVLWVSYVSLVDWIGCYSFNRSALLVLVMLSVMPGGKVWSVDAKLRAWWSRRRKGTVTEPASKKNPPAFEVLISAWPVRTIQWFLISWYSLSAIQKIHGSWYLFSSDDVFWCQLQYLYHGPIGFWALQHIPMFVFGILQMAALYFELFAPLWLIPRRTRPWGMITGITMHLLIALFMIKLWYFSAEMISFYIVFLPIGRKSNAC
jgi:hypothetical protein